MGVPDIWGTDPAEQAASYACDDFTRGPAEGWFRAVTAHADPPVLFRWLCQLRVAPYSYDLVDNLGRRSPRTLTPGLDELEVGQSFSGIFELLSFSRDEHITLRISDRKAVRAFGEVVVTYAIRPQEPGISRLVAKLAVPPAQGLLRGILNRMLSWGDLVMMRRQLLTLAALAARDQEHRNRPL